ncbi:PREDICTED: uncharacterized protein LOC106100844 [Papilio polytes]|uniref:uncharacterized protein LOC106100844 n=1 Tax=Papilio polytes TaxID=76194 RepID=UPI000676A1F1|nr:PREDICTED: uncharacterized protein LOC106100844 [Papilio polytes]
MPSGSNWDDFAANDREYWLVIVIGAGGDLFLAVNKVVLCVKNSFSDEESVSIIYILVTDCQHQNVPMSLEGGLNTEGSNAGGIFVQFNQDCTSLVAGSSSGYHLFALTSPFLIP